MLQIFVDSNKIKNFYLKRFIKVKINLFSAELIYSNLSP